MTAVIVDHKYRSGARLQASDHLVDELTQGCLVRGATRHKDAFTVQALPNTTINGGAFQIPGPQRNFHWEMRVLKRLGRQHSQVAGGLVEVQDAGMFANSVSQQVGEVSPGSLEPGLAPARHLVRLGANVPDSLPLIKLGQPTRRN